MFEVLLKKLDYYKNTIRKKYDMIYKNSFDVTKEVFDKSKDRLEIEKIKLELKKNYYDLGKYIAKQNLLKKSSDFSLDPKFEELTEKIKKNIEYYKNINREG
tara:strand:+ start:259 stop:564 length:306 start_codon:yes stop_codon:yes gene_type:complete